MPKITFSEEDLLRSKIIKPDWYVVKVTHVGTKPSSGNNPETTTIWPIDGVIIRASDGNTEFAGVPTPAGWNFNDNPKAKGFMVGFFNAFGIDVKPGATINLEAAEGRELEVRIENAEFEGRIVNKITHKYRKMKVAE